MNFRFLIVLLIVLINPVVGNAYDNTKVHRAINENALSQSNVDDYLKNKLGFEKGLAESFNGKKVKEWISEGGYREDEPVTRTLNHFYDPTKAGNAAGLNDSITLFGMPILTFTGESSVLWVQKSEQNAGGGTWSWPKARDYFYDGLTLKDKTIREESLAKAFKALGHIMHLVSDVSVPAHVRNDAHPGGDPYETYTEQAQALQYSGYATIILPKLTDFWDDEQGKGLAEFTNTNFFSKDRNEDNTYYTNPNVLAEEHGFFQEVTDADDNKEIVEVKYGLGTVTDSYTNASYTDVKLTAYSFWDFDYKRKTNKKIYFLNDTIHQTYADFLVPRAVGYSAGLLNYFFRGDIDLVPNYWSETEKGYLVENNTNEDMEGTFEIWYDDKEGKRKRLWEGYLSLKGSSGPVASKHKTEPIMLAYAGDTLPQGLLLAQNNMSEPITFELPEDSLDKCKYILVFRGKMGAEQGAVVGKIIDLSNYGTYAQDCTGCTKAKIEQEMSQYTYQPRPIGDGSRTETLGKSYTNTTNKNGKDIKCYEHEIKNPSGGEPPAPGTIQKPDGLYLTAWWTMAWTDINDNPYWYYVSNRDVGPLPIPLDCSNDTVTLSYPINKSDLVDQYHRPKLCYCYHPKNDEGKTRGDVITCNIRRNVSNCSEFKNWVIKEFSERVDWTWQQTTSGTVSPETYTVNYTDYESMDITSIEPDAGGKTITLTYKKTRTELPQTYSRSYSHSWNWIFSSPQGSKSDSDSYSSSGTFSAGGYDYTLETHTKKYRCEDDVFTEIE